MSSTTTTVDCRWIGYSGVGRVTEQFLRGLADIEAPGHWRLWGPEAVAPYAERIGAEHVVSSTSPLSRLGQAAWRSAPPADRYLYLHAVRPLRHSRRAVVMVHDTIPVRFAEPRWKRPLQRVFYAVSARTAGQVLVYSRATAERCRTDLGLADERMMEVRLATDNELVRRAQRARRGAGAHLLYVGLDRPQKNIRGAVLGFGRSTFSLTGGTFVIVGVQPDRVDSVRSIAETAGIRSVSVRSRCSDDELVALYANALALIVPSFEEGFGLPVVEGLAAGVPVCAAAVPALMESGRGIPVYFDPADVESIGSAVDSCVEMARAGAWGERLNGFEVRDLPTPADLASDVVKALDALDQTT